RGEHAGRRMSRVGALEAHSVDLVLLGTAHEPVLERHRAAGGLDPCAKRVVGRGEQVRVQAERPGEPRGDRGEGLAGPQGLRPNEVEADVAVTELEPGLAAGPPGLLERMPGLAATSPAALLVGDASQRVEDAV